MISMSGPPFPGVPGVPAILLAVAARLGFRVVSRTPTGQELGVLFDSTGDHPIVIGAGTAPGGCAWALLDAGPMPKMAYLLTRATYDALHSGSLAEDGALLYQGSCYRVQASFDGVTELIPI
jgi:hypothetical protein